jgi:hypothetical protein
MSENVKSILQALGVAFILYIVVILSLQLCVVLQKTIATGYMNSNCEIVGNSGNQRWYECDIR